MAENISKLEKKVAKDKNKKAARSRASGIIMIAVAVVLLIAAFAMLLDTGVLDPVIDKAKALFNKDQVSFDVDWKAYGKALAGIDETYSDCDKVIVKVGDAKITKKEYYKLRIADDYTFNALLEKYEVYCNEGDGKDLSDEEKEKLRPHRTTDEEILTSLAKVEMVYMEAMEAGVHMDDSVAYQQMQSTYSTYLAIVDLYSDQTDLDIYQSALESMAEMQLVAEGMGVSVDEYLKYLAEDNMKALAGALLEEKWQDEFKNSDYAGDVDDYIAEKYEAVFEKYTPEYASLEN